MCHDWWAYFNKTFFLSMRTYYWSFATNSISSCWLTWRLYYSTRIYFRLPCDVELHQNSTNLVEVTITLSLFNRLKDMFWLQEQPISSDGYLRVRSITPNLHHRLCLTHLLSWVSSTHAAKKGGTDRGTRCSNPYRPYVSGPPFPLSVPPFFAE